jgi:hypothetical protein
MTLDSFRQHLTIVAWINLIGGAIFAAVGILVFLFFFGIGAASGDPQALGILTVIGTVGSLLLIVAGLPGLLAGWGLLQRRAWARILGIVVAVLNLFNVPIGTALGIYTLYVLTDENAPGELS